jgi:5-enolpyruvylshikimate-3-phosphate synthase
MKNRAEHIECLGTEKGRVIHKAILDGIKKRRNNMLNRSDSIELRNKMNTEIEVEEGYSVELFQNIIETDFSLKYFGKIITPDNDITVAKVQAIYDKHKVLLNNMKENRAKEQDKTPDAELRLMDEMITSLAGTLGELYRFILYKE